MIVGVALTAAGTDYAQSAPMLEQVEHGRATTPFLSFGDRVRIEMFDRDGRSIFGAIDQKVVPAR